MKKIAIIFCFLFFGGAKAQTVIDHEWFNVTLFSTYSLADDYFGSTFKLALPLQRGFNFMAQGTAFPNLLNNEFDEFRYLFGVELIPINTNRFSFFIQSGLDAGIWRRVDEEGNPLRSNYIRDNSIMLGFGFDVIFDRWVISTDYKHYPEIFSNHISLGIKRVVFENKDIYRRYKRYMLNRNARKGKL